MNNEIVNVRKVDGMLSLKEDFFRDREISIHMKTDFRNSSPGRVDVSIFLIGKIGDQQFSVGKNKNVKHDSLASIRESLDKLGTDFTEMANQNTSGESFQGIIDEMMSKFGE